MGGADDDDGEAAGTNCDGHNRVVIVTVVLVAVRVPAHPVLTGVVEQEQVGGLHVWHSCVLFLRQLHQRLTQPLASHKNTRKLQIIPIV